MEGLDSLGQTEKDFTVQREISPSSPRQINYITESARKLSNQNLGSKKIVTWPHPANNVTYRGHGCAAPSQPAASSAAFGEPDRLGGTMQLREGTHVSSASRVRYLTWLKVNNV